MRNFSLTQLTYILALEEAKNFGAAARKCHVSQPSLSAQIQKLEDELGVLLFDRSRQPVVPTEIGRKVLVQARKVINDTQAIESIVLQEKGEIAGEFRLGIIPTLSQYLIPFIVRPFTSKYPKVFLVLEEGLTDQLIEKLKRDELDAAILVTPLENESIDEVPLFYEPFWVYPSPDHPLARTKSVKAGDLDPHDLWLLKEGHCFRAQALQLCKGHQRSAAGAREARAVRLESGNLEVLRSLVDQSGGLTLLPDLAVRALPAEERKRVRPFAKPAPVREVSLVQSRRHQKKRIFDALEGVIRVSIPRDLPQKAASQQVVEIK
jgi:LysR family hydrogen peroxide-inducible transcriptional activator